MPSVERKSPHAKGNGPCIVMALVLSACTPPPIYLFVEPSGPVPRVELRQPVGVVSRREVPLPIVDCGFFELKPTSRSEPLAFPVEIWRVMSLSPDGGVLELRYGVTPDGFTQVTPVEGRPPPLETGRRYSVECSGDGIGMAEFEIAGGSPRSPNPP